MYQKSADLRHIGSLSNKGKLPTGYSHRWQGEHLNNHRGSFPYINKLMKMAAGHKCRWHRTTHAAIGSAKPD